VRRAALSILAAFHLALALGAAVLWARSFHTEDRLFLADVNLTDRAGGLAYSWLGTSRGGRVLLLAHEDYDLNEGKLPVVRWRSRCVGRELAER